MEVIAVMWYELLTNLFTKLMDGTVIAVMWYELLTNLFTKLMDGTVIAVMWYELLTNLFTKLNSLYYVHSSETQTANGFVEMKISFTQ